MWSVDQKEKRRRRRQGILRNIPYNVQTCCAIVSCFFSFSSTAGDIDNDFVLKERKVALISFLTLVLMLDTLAFFSLSLNRKNA
jgi:hypothetical protein